jgi:hypothetical protein
MRKVKIGTALTNFAGEPIQDRTKEGEDKTVYVKDMLVQSVGQLFQAEDKNRAMLAYRTAQKIFNAQDVVLLEEAEYKICQDAVDPKRLSPMIFGGIMDVLDTAEAVEIAKTEPTNKKEK